MERFIDSDKRADFQGSEHQGRKRFLILCMLSERDLNYQEGKMKDFCTYRFVLKEKWCVRPKR